MGTIQYGGGSEIHIEDRALAHLKVAIATKLRRNESFTLSWHHPDGDAPGRSTIWLHPSIPLRFIFDDTETPELNAKWMQALMIEASSSGGIMLVDEVIDGPAEVESTVLAQ
ncbi:MULTISPECIES: hypothetical protein [unclassified Microbacterium]|uniref:DUF7882 family protein n=1 Tax=unclassified Microbacterium TaxID=2609290 RepID=UPI0021A30681|nr:MULTISPECIES: hypothetical protein [unclassified Microbacterium]MCT1364100.1 hypothetical protein [Microbacterium sp. p3-SID131]MCT1375258.1 hypothetical protein [Microbacterium sp. p3-SID337]